jgi:hypothetical protein
MKFKEIDQEIDGIEEIDNNNYVQSCGAGIQKCGREVW